MSKATQAALERIARCRELVPEVSTFGVIAALRLERTRGWEKEVHFDPAGTTMASSKPTGSEKILLSQRGYFRKEIKWRGIKLWRRVTLSDLDLDQLESLYDHLTEFLTG